MVHTAAGTTGNAVKIAVHEDEPHVPIHTGSFLAGSDFH